MTPAEQVTIMARRALAAVLKTQAVDDDGDYTEEIVIYTKATMCPHLRLTLNDTSERSSMSHVPGPFTKASGAYHAKCNDCQYAVFIPYHGGKLE